MVDHRTVERLEALPEPVPSGVFVVVDVIICSTAIIRLLEAGAASVRPFADTETAIDWRRTSENALLVGEANDGEAIEAFDLSPAPSQIAEATIKGRPVGIRTSNGTRAIDRIGLDRDIRIGSTINAAAVARSVASLEKPVWIVGAGRNGATVVEDTVGAATIAAAIRGNVSQPAPQLREAFAASPSAEWLRSVGDEQVIDALVRFHSSSLVPTLRDGVFLPYSP